MTNIGRILSQLLATERVEKAKTEREQERYARVVIKLDDPAYVGTDIEVHVVGDYLGKISYTGNSSVYLRLNNRHSGKIYAGEFRRTYAEFDRIYLTNPSSQTGKTLVFVVGGAFSGEIEPVRGADVGLVDSAGADVDPANLANQARMVVAEEASANALKGISASYVETHDGFPAYSVQKDTPVTGEAANYEYRPLISCPKGRLHVLDEFTSAIATDLAAIEVLQGVDGAGDLQKVKEELEKILLDTADIQIAVETLDNAISGNEMQVDVVTSGLPTGAATETGHLAGIETDTEAIKVAIEKIDDYEDPDYADHIRTIPAIESANDLLVVTSSAETDTIAAPGVGHALEIHGFIMSIVEIAPTTRSGGLTLGDGTIYLYAEAAGAASVNDTRTVVCNGIRVRLTANTALTLTNSTFTAGDILVYVVVRYKDVTL